MAFKDQSKYNVGNPKGRAGQLTYLAMTFTGRDETRPIRNYRREKLLTFTIGGTFGTGGAMLIEGTDDGVSWFTILTLNTGTRTGTTGRWPKMIRGRVSAGDGNTSLFLVISGIIPN